MMTPALEQKIAIILDYLDRLHRSSHDRDTENFRVYMDAADVQDWLEKKRKIGIPSNHFRHITEG